MKTRICPIVLSLILLVLKSGCATELENSDATQYVSMGELIANPSKFVDRRVSFIGYVVTNEDGTHIFLSMSHALFNDLPTAFQVQTHDGGTLTCNEEFVRINGRLSTDASGAYIVADVIRLWTIRQAGDRVSCLQSTPYE